MHFLTKQGGNVLFFLILSNLIFFLSKERHRLSFSSRLNDQHHFPFSSMTISRSHFLSVFYHSYTLIVFRFLSGKCKRKKKGKKKNQTEEGKNTKIQKKKIKISTFRYSWFDSLEIINSLSKKSSRRNLIILNTPANMTETPCEIWITNFFTDATKTFPPNLGD